jgi:outer membrane murein-binding lipoprotein Lpp
MLEDLDALTEKITLLASHVRTLRDENQRLRTQVANANVELDALRARIAGAMQRIDTLLERIPAEQDESAPSAKA